MMHLYGFDPDCTFSPVGWLLISYSLVSSILCHKHSQFFLRVIFNVSRFKKSQKEKILCGGKKK
jgi:hypothetical protein